MAERPGSGGARRGAHLGCMGRDVSPNFSRIAGGLKLAQTQMMAVAVGYMPDAPTDRLARRSPLLHRASFHGRGSKPGESNGSLTLDRHSHSLPGSPADRRPNFPEVVGSAESLVGRVLVEQGLGEFCDPEFVRYTSREMQEALDMTQEEMDRAAHSLLVRERQGRPLSFQSQGEGHGDASDPHL